MDTKDVTKEDVTKEDVIELTKEEKKTIKTYHDNIAKIKAALGAVRQQYLSSEQKAIEGIVKAESDYISYVKALSQSKDITIESEKWAFDPEKMIFRKIS